MRFLAFCEYLTAAEYAVRALLTGVEVDYLTLHEGGGFMDYVPRDILPPRAAYTLLIDSVLRPDRIYGDTYRYCPPGRGGVLEYVLLGTAPRSLASFPASW